MPGCRSDSNIVSRTVTTNDPVGYCRAPGSDLLIDITFEMCAPKVIPLIVEPPPDAQVKRRISRNELDKRQVSVYAVEARVDQLKCSDVFRNASIEEEPASVSPQEKKDEQPIEPAADAEEPTKEPVDDSDAREDDSEEDDEEDEDEEGEEEEDEEEEQAPYGFSHHDARLD